MNRSKPVATLAIIIFALLALGLGCSQTETTTSNTAAPANNAAANTTTAPPTTTAPTIDISGNYAATGTNVNGGGTYKADLLVTPRDDVFQFSWKSGTSKYDGVGVIIDNSVAVSYTDGENGDGCGVVLYKINVDGSLDGRVGYWGVNNAETEKATRTSGTDLDGKYDIVGKNPDGEEYKGTLAIKKDGEGYSFEWVANATPLSGYGIRTGNTAAVGFGGKQCAFVAYDLKPDGTLDGKWGGKGSKSFGTEVAKRK